MNESHLYVTYHTIYADVTRIYQHMNFDEGDVEIWCNDLVLRYIKDVTTMATYEAVECEVNQDTGIVSLPCNIFRILDVYDSSGYVEYNKDGLDGFFLRLTGTSFPSIIYLNYKGIPMNSEGEFLLAKGYEPAAETMCVYNMIKRKMGTPEFDRGLYADLGQQLSYQIQAARADVFKFIDRADLHKSLLIMYNAIPKVGYQKLFNQTHK